MVINSVFIVSGAAGFAPATTTEESDIIIIKIENRDTNSVPGARMARGSRKHRLKTKKFFVLN